jgi:hypothetical protein
MVSGPAAGELQPRGPSGVKQAITAACHFAIALILNYLIDFLIATKAWLVAIPVPAGCNSDLTPRRCPV